MQSLKNFFKPTKITVIAFFLTLIIPVMLMLMVLPFALAGSPNKEMSTVFALIIFLILPITIGIKISDLLQLNNSFDLVVIYAIPVVFAYVIGSIISWIYYKIKNIQPI